MSDRARYETSVGDTDIAVLARQVGSSANAIVTMTSGQVPVTARQRFASLPPAIDLLALRTALGHPGGSGRSGDVGRCGDGRHPGPRPPPRVPTGAPACPVSVNTRLHSRSAELGLRLNGLVGGIGFEGCCDGFELGECCGKVFHDLAGNDLWCWQVLHVLE